MDLRSAVGANEAEQIELLPWSSFKDLNNVFRRSPVRKWVDLGGAVTCTLEQSVS